MAARRPPQVPSPVVPMPDPPIEMGSFRALPRITGGFVICDERRPPFERAVRFCTSESAARVAVSELGLAEWLERKAKSDPKVAAIAVAPTNPVLEDLGGFGRPR